MAPHTASSTCWVLAREVLRMLLLAQNLSRERMLNPLTLQLYRVQLTETKRQLGMCHAFFLDLFPDVIFKAFQGCHLLCLWRSYRGVSGTLSLVGTYVWASFSHFTQNVNSLFRKYGKRRPKSKTFDFWKLDWNFEIWTPRAPYSVIHIW